MRIKMNLENSLFRLLNGALLFTVLMTESVCALNCNATELGVAEKDVLALTQSGTGQCLVLAQTPKPNNESQAFCESQYNGTLASGHTTERWDAIWKLVQQAAPEDEILVALFQDAASDALYEDAVGWSWITPQANYTIESTFLEANVDSFDSYEEYQYGIFTWYYPRVFDDGTFNDNFRFMCEFATNQTDGLKCNATELNVPANMTLKLNESHDCFVLVDTQKNYEQAQSHCETVFNGSLVSGHTTERWQAIWTVLKAFAPRKWLIIAMIQDPVSDQNPTTSAAGWKWVTPQANYSIDEQFFMATDLKVKDDVNQIVGQIYYEPDQKELTDNDAPDECKFICEFEFQPDVGVDCSQPAEATQNNTKKPVTVYKRLIGQFEGTSVRLDNTADILNATELHCMVACSLNVLCRSFSYSTTEHSCRMHYALSTDQCFQKKLTPGYAIFDQI